MYSGSLRLLYGLLVVFLLDACSPTIDSPICVKQWTKSEQIAQAKQERTIAEGSPIAMELLDYARLRKEVAKYCQ